MVTLSYKNSLLSYLTRGPSIQQCRLKVLCEPCRIITYYTTHSSQTCDGSQGDNVKALDPLPHTLKGSSTPIK
ncbi:conserved hypothetical protein [Ricinus communis]|uniref:Uncharacterized protein n=1 Tax=Ricinus communis TaxID=3988 RepID=B9T0N3_RICCO|nr:conserved hypothetical protein [Ricinus communis]